MLVLEGLRVTQDGFTLEADFACGTFERMAVVGPSGSGKSTLLGAIAGFVPLSAGRVVWEGRDISALDPGARPFSMMFQDNNLFPHLTAAQNVGLGIRPSARLDAGETARVDAALARVGLEAFGARKPGQLSGGQQGRVALARVLVQRKPMVLLDEPFAALGPAMRREMLKLLLALCAETGARVMMVSHDISDAEHFADGLIWVDGGRAEAPRALAEMLAAPSAAMRAYLGD